MMWLCSASHQQAYSHWKSLTHEIFLSGEKFHLCLQTWARTQSQLELIPMAKTTGFSRAFGGVWPLLGTSLHPCVETHKWLFLLLGTAREASRVIMCFCLNKDLCSYLFSWVLPFDSCSGRYSLHSVITYSDLKNHCCMHHQTVRAALSSTPCWSPFVFLENRNCTSYKGEFSLTKISSVCFLQKLPGNLVTYIQL